MSLLRVNPFHPKPNQYLKKKKTNKKTDLYISQEFLLCMFVAYIEINFIIVDLKIHLYLQYEFGTGSNGIFSYHYKCLVGPSC